MQRRNEQKMSASYGLRRRVAAFKSAIAMAHSKNVRSLRNVVFDSIA